jgi:hypothetical protein
MYSEVTGSHMFIRAIEEGLGNLCLSWHYSSGNLSRTCLSMFSHSASDSTCSDVPARVINTPLWSFSTVTPSSIRASSTFSAGTASRSATHHRSRSGFLSYLIPSVYEQQERHQVQGQQRYAHDNHRECRRCICCLTQVFCVLCWCCQVSHPYFTPSISKEGVNRDGVVGRCIASQLPS